MKNTAKKPSRQRRDDENPVPLIEKMHAAREFSSCCIGVEALLETDNKIDAYARRRNKTETEPRS